MNGCKNFLNFFQLKEINAILLCKQNEQQKTSVLELTVFIYLFLMVYSMFDKCIVCYCWGLWSYYGPVARGLHLQSPLRSTSSLQINPSWYMYITMYLKKIESSEQWYFSTFSGWMHDTETSHFPLLSTLSVSSAPMVAQVADTRGGEGGDCPPNNFSWSFHFEKWKHNDNNEQST